MYCGASLAGAADLKERSCRTGPVRVGRSLRDLRSLWVVLPLVGTRQNLVPRDDRGKKLLASKSLLLVVRFVVAAQADGGRRWRLDL
jgi:hypothetical protein